MASNSWGFFFTASIMVFGSVTGATFGGWQSGKFGRRNSMLIDSIVYFIGLLMLAFAPNFYIALVSRFILGHAGKL